MYSVYADLRDKKGVKDMDVSRALGFHPSVISDWKRGKATPKYDKLKLIADYFDVSVEYLATGVQPDRYYLNDETSEMAKDLYDRRDLRTLFSLAKNCTEDQVNVLVKMAETWNK